MTSFQNASGNSSNPGCFKSSDFNMEKNQEELAPVRGPRETSISLAPGVPATKLSMTSGQWNGQSMPFWANVSCQLEQSSKLWQCTSKSEASEISATGSACLVDTCRRLAGLSWSRSNGHTIRNESVQLTMHCTKSARIPTHDDPCIQWSLYQPSLGTRFMKTTKKGSFNLKQQKSSFSQECYFLQTTLK